MSADLKKTFLIFLNDVIEDVKSADGTDSEIVKTLIDIAHGVIEDFECLVQEIVNK